MNLKAIRRPRRNPWPALRILAVSVVALAGRPTAAAGENWPQWRGPSASGVSNETDLPIRWGHGENIAWEAPLAGQGSSSPIIWGDRIFVTSQIGSGPTELDFPGDAGNLNEDAPEVTLVIECFSRADGGLLWSHRIDAGDNLPPVHASHNFASPSCVTDGQRVIALFGTGQLLCLDLEGRIVWERNLAKEISTFRILRGHGSSPLLHEGYLYLLCDHEPGAYLLALDKRTGQTLWKSDRGADLVSYSTPVIVRSSGPAELLINSNRRMDAYDPRTGRNLWFVTGDCIAPAPTPIAVNGIIYASRGYSSGPYMAIRPGGDGDVTGSHLLWRVPTGAPYVSSLLHYRDLLYMATELGVVRCVEPGSGKTVWSRRVGGTFTASPVAAEGRIYFLDESGECFVFAAGREATLLARNSLDDLCRASPAISQGRIFIRARERLYGIGPPRATAAP